MKFKKYIGYIAVSMALVSCNMDLFPDGQLIDEKSLETMDDAASFRNGMYAHLRARTCGGLISVPEIQSDMFHALSDFSNRGGQMYQWQFTSSDEDVEGVWAGCYSSIANANFFIQRLESFISRNAEDLTISDMNYLNMCKGEAYFLRAFCHNILAEKYCKAYDPATAEEEASGLPLQLTYAPTSESAKYPSRSTLAATYKVIKDDLDSAAMYITATGLADSEYLTADAVDALQARVALNMQDWQTAYTEAENVINTGKYNLISNLAQFQSMWTNDNGQESVLQFFGAAANGEIPSSSAYNYQSYDVILDLWSADFVPETGVLNLYDKQNDIRYNTYFKTVNLSFSGGGKESLVVCNKYPGNPAFYVMNSNYCNKPKVFRVAEMYLIASEAYYRAGDETNSLKYLNALRTKRISGYTDQSYTGDELFAEIKNERVKELFAEGFRMNDLKRWGDEMRRSAAQNDTYTYLPGSQIGSGMLQEAGAYQFVWPIPKTEIDANPKLKFQQNEGY